MNWLIGFKTKGNRPESGFTLIELLIVVFILGILATVGLQLFIAPSLEAKEAALRGNLAAFRKAISFYSLQHDDSFPDQNESNMVSQLTEKTDKNGDPGVDYGPYLRKIPINPINNLKKIMFRDLPEPPNDSSGWYYDQNKGEIRANSSGAGPSGINYIDL
jgi:prepilin-type N-terminal cleavage/methylation domain-containing protein